jgi:hypothetical protein
MRNRIIAAAIALAISCASATGYADDRERALQLGNEGLELYNQESYETALQRFSEAESLVHSPVFVLYMARIEHRRGRWVRAIAHYDRVLGEPLSADAPDTWRRAREEATIEHQRIVEEVPTLRIVIDAPADAVSIWVDGKSVQRWQEPIRVDPGKHQIAAQYLQRSQTKRIEVESGDDTDVKLDFDAPPRPAPQAAPRVPPIAPTQEEEGADAGPSDQKIAGYALLAIGGAAALAFGGVSIALAVQDRAIASHCLERVCPDELEDDIFRHDQLSKATVGLAIGFAITLITGGIVTGTAPKRSPMAGSFTWSF